MRHNLANTVSNLGAVLCIASGTCLAVRAPLLIVAVLFALGGACDAIDGWIARRASRGETVARGALIDSLSDKLGEAGLVVGLSFRFADGAQVRLLLGATLAGLLASYAKAVSREHRVPIRWPEARMFGRAGRVLILALTLFAAAAANTEDVLIGGVYVLLAFNVAVFGWRLARVAIAVRPVRAAAAWQPTESRPLSTLPPASTPAQLEAIRY
jgi:phosphatidylglycerophosphate synthase